MDLEWWKRLISILCFLLQDQKNSSSNFWTSNPTSVNQKWWIDATCRCRLLSCSRTSFHCLLLESFGVIKQLCHLLVYPLSPPDLLKDPLQLSRTKSLFELQQVFLSKLCAGCFIKSTICAWLYHKLSEWIVSRSCPDSSHRHKIYPISPKLMPSLQKLQEKSTLSLSLWNLSCQ